MNPPPSTHQPAAPTIQTRHQLDAVIENIVQLQLDYEDLRRQQEKEIVDIRQKYRAPLAELERYLTLETSWAEAWAKQNPDAFSDQRPLVCTHAVIGFRVTPPRVERASRKWNWADIAGKLGELAWGKRYLRQPALEVNKEALLADRAELATTDLRQVGIKILQDERFYITPHHATPESTQTENSWQDAA
jgi:phage host-nuclease inhibitor protein Gam